MYADELAWEEFKSTKGLDLLLFLIHGDFINECYVFTANAVVLVDGE